MIWSAKPRSEIWNDGDPFEDFLGSESAPAIARRHLCYGGGKSGNTTQSQQATAGPPAWVSSALQNLYGQAQGVAAQPFQQYGGEFVAPVNSQQNTAIGGINQAAQTYAPYGQAATSALIPAYGASASTLNQGLGAGQALTMQGAQPVSASNINQYMSPYIRNVVQATENQQNFQNQQQQSQLQGNAVLADAFGGDRGGVAAANLAYQQNLANQPVIANLYNQGYNTALGAAQQQQQTELGAGQQLFNQGLGASQQYQNIGTGLSQNLSGLGTTAQTNQLTAANAQLGAGTLQQQTQQAQDTAKYNQFLQQQAYPFQTTQFLANILEGLSPNAGSTTTSTGVATQPMSFFKRGGAVHDLEMGEDGEYRLPRAGGGSANDNDIASILAAHAQMYPALAGYGSAGPYGLALSGGAHGQTLQPHTMQMPQIQKSSGLGSSIQGINQAVSLGENLGKLYGAGKGAVVGTPAGKDPKAQPATGGLAGYGGVWGASNPNDPSNVIPFPNPTNAPTLPDGTPISDDIFHRGGRVGYAYGGMPYADQISDPIVPEDISNPRPVDTLKPTPMAGLSGGSTSSGLGKGIQSLGQIASIASMFLAKGGRVHKEEGGGFSASAEQGQDDYGVGRMTLAPDARHTLRQDAAFENAMRYALRNTPQPTDSALSSYLASPNPITGWRGASNPQMFFKGGRVHRDTGGGLSGPPDVSPGQDDFDRLLIPESGGRHFDATGAPTRSSKGAIGIAQVMPGTGPEAAKIAGVEWNPTLFNQPRTGDLAKDKEAEEYNKTLGRAYYEKQKQDFGNSQAAYAAYNAGPAAVRTAQAKAQELGGSYLDFLPKETQQYVAGLGGQKSAGLSGIGAGSGFAGDSQASSALAASADQPSWWDKQSGGLSGTERAIISALSGLGGMASSPSRFLGSAVLQGLGAGAQTYGGLAQKGMGLDISQQQANTAQGKLGIAQATKSIEVYNILRQQASGYIRAGLPIPPELKTQIDSLASSLYPMASGQRTAPTLARQVNAAPGALPSPGATPAVLPSAPIKTTPLPPPASVPSPGAPLKRLPDGTPITDQPLPTSLPLPPMPAKVPEANANINDTEFRRQIGPDRDPTVLRARAAQLAANGDAAGAKEMMDKAVSYEDKYMTTGKAMTEDGKVIGVPGWSEQQAAVGRVEPNQKWLDEQGSQALARAQAREQLDVIKGVLENYESGSLNGMKAQAQALGKALGVPVPDTATMNAAAYEKFMKSTLRNVFADVKDMGGRPLVSEIQGFEKSTASPELQPEANKEILAQLYAKINQQDKFYGDAATELTKNKALDRGSFMNDWLKKDENKVAPMVDTVKKDLAVRGATPTDPKQFQEGHTYIIEPNRFPGYPPGKYKAIHKDGKFGLQKVE